MDSWLQKQAQEVIGLKEDMLLTDAEKSDILEINRKYSVSGNGCFNNNWCSIASNICDMQEV